MAKKRVKPKLGDVVEIPVEGDLAYFQYTYKHTIPPVWGDLIQVLSKTHKKRLGDINSVILQPIQFSVFVHLSSLVKQPGVSIVGNYEIPESRQEFPIMKSGNENPVTGLIDYWCLFNGEEVWPVGVLPDKFSMASFKMSINLPSLQEKIASGYSPLDDVKKYGIGIPVSEGLKKKYADVIRRRCPEILDD